MRAFKFTLTVAALALFIAACSAGQTSAPVNTANTARPADSNQTVANNAPVAPTAAVDEMAATKKTYAEKCAACHKEDGTGGKVTIEGETINAENLTTDKMKRMPDAKYVEYIEKGIPDEGMPAFKGKLTDEQIASLVKYIRTEFQK
jgi:mono/diheme cytochrome c family protein